MPNPHSRQEAASTIPAAETPPTTTHTGTPTMTDREVALAMIALIASMFVAMLSNLVVLTAMPRIAADLHAGQAEYTWIITSSMLTIAVCTPIWGRVSDLVDKKLLMQICVGGYVVFSFLASMAPHAWFIIACRVGIGVCAGGIIVLLQTISAAIMSPRKRARWIGYRAAALSVATVGAPSFGGLVTEHLGWRACFLVGIPFALASIAMLQKTLHLPRGHGTRPRIDWAGALLLAGGIVCLMLWVSVTGPRAGFLAPPSLALLGGGLALLAVAVAVELKVAVPILPVGLFRQHEVLMCVVASSGIGIGMFGSAVFLAPYLQIGRGLEPAAAGLMALPEAAGSLLASILTARILSRRGHYRGTLVVGGALLVGGFAMLSTLDTHTPFVLIGSYVAFVGAGLGITGETLTIVVQNAVARGHAGSAGALVAFFRMLGGITGVAVLGAVLSGHVQRAVAASGLGPLRDGAVPLLAQLAPPLRMVVQSGYCSGVALLYLSCVPIAMVTLAALALLPRGVLSDDDPLA